MSFWQPVDNVHKKILRTTDKPFYLKNNSATVTFDGLFKIVIVLDESGSMQCIRDQIIDSINDLIAEQKQIKEKPSTFTLVKFNDTVKNVIVNKLLTDVRFLSSLDYEPNGPTALYDAIGETVEWFRNEKDVLMVIVTDGQENASKKYNKNQINKMIDDKKNHNNWTYVYLSSDSLTEKQGDNLGLQKSAYSSNCKVRQEVFGNFISGSLNSAIGNYRTNDVSVQNQLK